MEECIYKSDCEIRRELEHEGGDLERLDRKLCDDNLKSCNQYIIRFQNESNVTEMVAGVNN